MNFLEKIKLVFEQPGILFRYRSIKIRKIYYIFSKYLHLGTLFSRKKRIDNKSDLYFKGYEKIEINSLNQNNIDINSTILEIENKIKNYDFKNQFNHLKSIEMCEIFDTDSKVFKFLTSKFLIEKVSNYLGCIPLLTYSSIWYSKNDEMIANSSQEYHLDHEDYMQVKGFLYLEDIDQTNGAMNLFSKKNSNEVIKNINYNTSPEKKRLKDDIFEKFENEKIICDGKKGTLYLVDTSSCFHCGARKSLGSRLLLSFQFITPWANYLKWNWRNSDIIGKNRWKNKNLNSLQKKILGII